MLKKYYLYLKIKHNHDIKKYKNRYGFEYKYINYSNELNIKDIIKYNSNSKDQISIRLDNIIQLHKLQEKVSYIDYTEAKTEIKEYGFVDVTPFFQGKEALAEI